jgi:hypothetical protein
MPHTGLACPTCDKELMTGGGAFGYRCENAHVYSDTEALLAMNPRRIPIAMPIRKPQDGLAELRLSIPAKLIEALREKFKDKLEAAATIIFTALLDAGSFIVTGFDVERLKELFGQKIDNSGKMIGLIYSMKVDRDEARKEAEAYKSNLSAGAPKEEVNSLEGNFVQVSLRLEIEDYMAIQDKARFNNSTAPNYISEVIKNALSNNWF